MKKQKYDPAIIFEVGVLWFDGCTQQMIAESLNAQFGLNVTRDTVGGIISRHIGREGFPKDQLKARQTLGKSKRLDNRRWSRQYRRSIGAA